jgi:carbonic anhydrase/acetyltransferase-like protein (isoleucine patch superfamily)
MGAYRLDNLQPQIHPSAFIAPGAVIIGQAEVKEKASVWFGAIIRSDTERIVIGAGSNVQDGAVLHADPGDPCILGSQVTIGHRAVVHGATIDDGALVGIGAIVLNQARIGKGAMVGAGAVVPPGMEIPDGMLAVGVPAKIRGPVDATKNAANYIELSGRYLKGLSPLVLVGQFRITMRGQDALNPFSDLHLQLKRAQPEALATLKTVAEGRMPETTPEILHELAREGFIRSV